MSICLPGIHTLRFSAQGRNKMYSETEIKKYIPKICNSNNSSNNDRIIRFNEKNETKYSDANNEKLEMNSPIK